MKEKEFLPLVKERLKIDEINPMQRRMMDAASESRDIILLSPTGSGKTLAFLLPVLKILRPFTGRIQAVIIAPSRELVLQIFNVLREISGSLKATALYGGHKVEDEVNSLQAGTDIIVATPGRLLDHIRRRNIDVMPCRIAVLDEFDKSLELGFEDEMKKIFTHLKNVSRIILTSATRMPVLPAFLKLNNPLELSYLDDNRSLRHRMKIHRIDADGKDKLETLLSLLNNLSAEKPIGKTIVFANHRESAERIYNFLRSKGVSVVLYHGALDQKDREKAIAVFNNGSKPVLIATDLASRGLDIADVDNIIHYHLPLQEETYTHRNGRTARVDSEGNVYVLVGPQETPAAYIVTDDTFRLIPDVKGNLKSNISTLYITAGKKEKLSRGDILGFLTAQEGLQGSSIGKIDVKDHFSLVALDSAAAQQLLRKGNNFKIKGTTRRIFPEN